VTATGATESPLHDLLGSISVSRARLGFTPSETATFVFSLKEPRFRVLRQHLGLMLRECGARRSRAGYDGHLTKPVEPASLRAAVAQLLDARPR
jgi:CheY-like chemotaxis protein